MTSFNSSTTAGAVIVLIGIVAVLSGIGMDSTNTAVTCYETSGIYASSGCVETTYYDPSGPIFAITVGTSAIIGGGYLITRKASIPGFSKKVSKDDDESSTLQSQIERQQKDK